MFHLKKFTVFSCLQLFRHPSTSDSIRITVDVHQVALVGHPLRRVGIRRTRSGARGQPPESDTLHDSHGL